MPNISRRPYIRAHLYAGVCAAALAVSPVLAADYVATSQTDLTNKIGMANGDGAPSSTITLGNDVTLDPGAQAAATKNLTIDSGNFTFLKTYSSGNAPNGVIQFGAAAGTVTLKGTVTGVNGGGNTVGQLGLLVAGGTVINDATVIAGQGSGTGTGGTGFGTQGTGILINNASITSGNSTGANGGQGGIVLGTSTFINNAGGSLIAGNGLGGGNGINAGTGANGVTITNSGIIKGGNGTTGAGGIGISATRGSAITNNAGGSITGGDGTTGGNGVTVSGQSAAIVGTLTNSGTITGGNGTAGNGGHGISAGNFATLISNSGTIQGGTSATGTGGYGVNFTPSAHSLTNDGTIHGGDGVVGGVGILFAATGTGNTIVNIGTIQGGNGSGDGVGISVHAGLTSLTNIGTIVGGDGASAIVNAVNAPINMINSGAVTAGAGQAIAINMLSAGDLTLELHKGSVITGNVVSFVGNANSLILGGDDNASFDVSTVGPQYQNFTSYQKTGNSVWSITGIGTTATPWVINQGTVQMSDGASMIGDVTDNATLAFNNSTALTFANTVTGTGRVNQVGSGTTTLTGNNTYAGGTFINAGALSVANDANLGDVAGMLTINGGTLENTGSFASARAVALTGNGTLQTDGDLTLSGTISGGGALTKTGGGTLVLTADNSYSGGTTIGGGTLQLGDGGTTGSIQGDVVNNGALVGLAGLPRRLDRAGAGGRSPAGHGPLGHQRHRQFGRHGGRFQVGRPVPGRGRLIETCAGGRASVFQPQRMGGRVV